MAVTVLVSGGGGAAAISTIKALRMGGFDGRIVSTDAERLSAGLYLADAFRVVPRAKTPLSSPLSPADRRRAHRSHLPDLGLRHLRVCPAQGELEAMGCGGAMSDADAMATCENKWQFYLKDARGLSRCRKPAVMPDLEPISLFCEAGIGKGSRDTHRCATREELDFHMLPARDMLIQEYLPGEEYTVDVLSDLSGAPVLAVPRAASKRRRHLLQRTGFRDEEIWSGFCLDLARHLGLKGPTCMQLKRDEAGRPKFMEVNPRIGGGSMFTTLAGVNIPILLLRLIAGMELAPQKAKEIVVLRYYEEVVLDNQ